jgi:glutamate dehydrogenase
VRVVAPDMPFLVESIGIVFSQMNIAVHLIVHPVLDVRRDARGRLLAVAATSAARTESWQMIEIDRPRDEPQARELLRRVHRALEDVRKAVTDFRRMLERVRAVANELETRAPAVPKSHAERGARPARWMHDGHFVFLGYRYYRLKRGRARDALVRDCRQRARHPAHRRAASRRDPSCSPAIAPQARAPELLVLTKANTRRPCIAAATSTTSA